MTRYAAMPYAACLAAFFEPRTDSEMNVVVAREKYVGSRCFESSVMGMGHGRS